MTRPKKIWEFPVASTSLADDVRLFYPGGDVWLYFSYYDSERESVFNSGIVFENVQAHRHTCEMFLMNESKTKADFFMCAYDAIIEYVNSEWVEYFRNLDKKTSDYWNIKHFGILLDSSGFFEFISTGFRILDTKEGSLSEF
jgi:hypothetical protein